MAVYDFVILGRSKERSDAPRMQASAAAAARPLSPAFGKGEEMPHPAIASGCALLLGIWMSISSVDMVAPRSIETCK